VLIGHAVGTIVIVGVDSSQLSMFQDAENAVITLS